FPRVAQGGAIAAVWHRHDHIRLKWILTRELASHLDAHFVNVAIINRAVRAREIDIFENAKSPALMLRKCLDASQPIFVDDDDFARLDIADELRMNQIKRAGFAGEHPRVTHLAAARGAEPICVAQSYQLLLRLD